jgi:hypothetical protein
MRWFGGELPVAIGDVEALPALAHAGPPHGHRRHPAFVEARALRPHAGVKHPVEVEPQQPVQVAGSKAPAALPLLQVEGAKALTREAKASPATTCP